MVARTGAVAKKPQQFPYCGIGAFFFRRKAIVRGQQSTTSAQKLCVDSKACRPTEAFFETTPFKTTIENLLQEISRRFEASQHSPAMKNITSSIAKRS